MKNEYGGNKLVNFGTIGIAFGVVILAASVIGSIIQITDKNRNTDLLVMMNDKHINNKQDEMQMYHVDELRKMMEEKDE